MTVSTTTIEVIQLNFFVVCNAYCTELNINFVVCQQSTVLQQTKLQPCYQIESGPQQGDPRASSSVLAVCSKVTMTLGNREMDNTLSSGLF